MLNNAAGEYAMGLQTRVRVWDRITTRSSATTEIARDADDVDFKHSRSLKVIRCLANRRGIYDFLLALNSNLTSIFNCSWYTTPS